MAKAEASHSDRLGGYTHFLTQIRPDSQKYLRFTFMNMVFQSTLILFQHSSPGVYPIGVVFSWDHHNDIQTL